ncbi:MAG: OsmC family protein [Leptospiraceae bacterium]|nr:OsmC family protein [Leptospiraceae bacterium]
MSEHIINLIWKSESEEFKYETYDRTHQIQFAGGQTLSNSAAKDFLGNEEYSNPEELLVAALSSCQMLTFLAIAAKKKLIVKEYTDKSVGILEKGSNGKLQITKIYLRPHIRFTKETTPTEEVFAKLHETAHINCFIGNSISSEVIIEPILLA